MHCESFMLLAKCNWVEGCEEIGKKKDNTADHTTNINSANQA